MPSGKKLLINNQIFTFIQRINEIIFVTNENEEIIEISLLDKNITINMI